MRTLCVGAPVGTSSQNSSLAPACVPRQLLRAEHCVMATEPLQNLTEQSAGVGTWLLSVANEPRPVEYTWKKKPGQMVTGKKFECLLVSEDSTEYCLGVYKRKSKEPVATREFKAAAERFKKVSVWKVNKISLVKTDSKYLGCSHKVVIDLNTSNFQPVRQSTVQMPKQATPPNSLRKRLT